MGKLLRGFFFFGLVLTMGCGDSQENTRVAGDHRIRYLQVEIDYDLAEEPTGSRRRS